mgnify:CR=1 FL=1
MTKYADMTPEQALKLKTYLRERHKRLYVPKKDGTFSSKYRYKNRGDNYGITAHKVIAEKVLGRPLPKGAEIHHVDGNGLNNEHRNLVICPDHAYHALLHIRQRALDACGNANWLPCAFCKEHDDPKNMTLYTPKDQTSPRANHARCATNYLRQRREKEGS